MQYAAFQNKLMTEYISKAAIHSQGLQLLARPSSVVPCLPSPPRTLLPLRLYLHFTLYFLHYPKGRSTTTFSSVSKLRQIPDNLSNCSRCLQTTHLDGFVCTRRTDFEGRAGSCYHELKELDCARLTLYWYPSIDVYLSRCLKNFVLGKGEMRVTLRDAARWFQGQMR